MRITGKTAAEIFESIRLQVQAGHLANGQVLPPVRELAARLEVNRNTVAAAYKRLVGAGLALTQGRLGTLIHQPQGPGEQEGGVPGSPLTDLASGNPAPGWLPDLGAALARRRYRPRLYGEALLDPELEQYGRDWLASDCPRPFALDLASGAVDAMERLLGAWLAPGDKVALEDPGFISSINTLRIAGFQAVGVAIDQHGMRPEALREALEHGAQAVIITPRAHNPSGCSLSPQRAAQLREVLRSQPQALVIVDDHFALLAQAPYCDPIPPEARRWALVRSLSKALGPDLRLAFLASDAQTSQRLRLRLAPGTNWVSHLLQDAALACLQHPQSRALIDQARQDYGIRREQLAEALAQQGLAVATPADGLNLWLPLEAPGQPLAAALARAGWLARSGESFGVTGPAHGLRLTVSGLDAEQARRFASDLRQALESLA